MRLAVVHASVGHGHTKAAEAIREGFLACGVPGEEILLLDALDETPSWFRSLYTSIYYYSVKHVPGAWGQAYSLSDRPWFYQKIGRWGRRWLNGWVGKRLLHRLTEAKPEAIISTHFLTPEVLGWAKNKGALSSLLVTVVTDFSPHLFWINPGTDYYWVMSEEGARELRNRGIPADRIRGGGIPVSLRFRPQGKKNEFRKKEGLDEERFTLLITSGSFGLGPAQELLDALREFGGAIQVLVVCGRNEALYQSLKGENYPFRLKRYGFISHMDELMEASDLIVTKPGGATSSESLAKGIPLVVVEPIPGQETRNSRLLKERNTSFFLKKPSDIKIILKGILDYPEVLEEKRRTIRQLAKPEAAVELARFVLDKIKR